MGYFAILVAVCLCAAVALAIFWKKMYKWEEGRSAYFKQQWYEAEARCLCVEGRFSHDKGITWYEPNQAGGYSVRARTPQEQLPYLAAGQHRQGLEQQTA